MILQTENLKNVCSKILAAVDSGDYSIFADTLQIKAKDGVLTLSVTNGEYFVKVTENVDEVDNFNATVNANLFLKLISQITTETVEFSCNDKALTIKANGVYNLPLIYHEDRVLELTEIKIDNPVKEFNIDSEVLLSILNFNMVEITKNNTTRKPIQKLFYVDGSGAITWASSACVNNFTLKEDVKLLLGVKLVKLFRLFKDGDVHFTLGFDKVQGDSTIQTKVRFEWNNITITAVLTCDDDLLSKVPVAAIRGRANGAYPFSVDVDKELLKSAITRLLLFSANKSNVMPYGIFEFKRDKVTIYDVGRENSETLYYESSNVSDIDYVAPLDLVDIKATLDGCTEQLLTVNFGDGQCVSVVRGNVKNIVPELNEDF